LTGRAGNAIQPARNEAERETILGKSLDGIAENQLVAPAADLFVVETVQVLPFSVGAHLGMTGPFTMLRFAERSMDVVFIEQRGGAIYLERPADVDLHEATSSD
jgi:hypothetical protein